MNGGQIEDALRGHKFASQYSVGVFPADQLPLKEFQGSDVVNTNDSDQHGQHWVAFFSVDNIRECFDSFGRNPGEYSDKITHWLDGTYQVVQCETLRSRESTVCEQYCLFFILLRFYGYSYQDVMSALSKNTVINDKFVCKFVNKLFRIKTSLKDKYFTLQNLV